MLLSVLCGSFFINRKAEGCETGRGIDGKYSFASENELFQCALHVRGISISFASIPVYVCLFVTVVVVIVVAVVVAW